MKVKLTPLGVGVAAVIATLLLAWRAGIIRRPPTANDVIGGVYVQPALSGHSKEFDTPQIIKVQCTIHCDSSS